MPHWPHTVLFTEVLWLICANGAISDALSATLKALTFYFNCIEISL